MSEDALFPAPRTRGAGNSGGERARDVRDAAQDPRVVDRFQRYVRSGGPSDCWWWCGAVASAGHGRFWIRSGLVVIAHRFAWALDHPGDVLPRLLAHECDNSLCQNPEHLHATDQTGNRREWAARRHQLGSPLRDVRGSRGRAVAVRDAVRAGDNVAAAIAAGVRPIDAGQGVLWSEPEDAHGGATTISGSDQ
ncbi:MULTISPECIES: hypothetical protein [unclassified Cellulomonas]|uniref:hypothetical protein n=1 Tax=unclassified Cellulomonas TaxID=2620175 RepID=UPI001C500FA0|nr:MULTISPECIES: hypothetical protein [unclassified Cellulomonas]MBW0256335.1 hypothetical protein [Cellulomonas sp. PS-H5]MCG7284645.1 hypothetical protein [Cellulomonas sp. ACRRI]